MNVDNQLINKALGLKPQEKFYLIELLTMSLDKPAPQINEIWLKEAETHLKDLENVKNLYDSLLLHFNKVLKAKNEWEKSLDCIDDIIILVDMEDKILRCNMKLLILTGKDYHELLNRRWQHIMNKEYGFTIETKEQYHIEISHQNGEFFHFHSNVVEDKDNVVNHHLIYCHNVTKLKTLREDLKKSKKCLEKKNMELEKSYAKLKEMQAQILHQEKMASIGQLAAGVAHEINNPIGFIMSNLNTLRKYVDKTEEFLNMQSKAIEELSSRPAEKDKDIILNPTSTNLS